MRSFTVGLLGGGDGARVYARGSDNGLMTSTGEDDTEPLHEATLRRDNGWTARVIKNNDDDGWAGTGMARTGSGRAGCPGAGSSAAPATALWRGRLGKRMWLKGRERQYTLRPTGRSMPGHRGNALER
jgi:hypothetical protein